MYRWARRSASNRAEVPESWRTESLLPSSAGTFGWAVGLDLQGAKTQGEVT